MNQYVILTDSSCDLTKELANELQVSILNLEILLEDGTSLLNDQIEINEFYKRIRNKEKITTSAAGIDRFTNFMEQYLAEGKDVLYLGFSSGLSGTYNAAFIAARELSEKYPERKVYTVDTLCASLGQGLLVYLCAKLRLSGADIEEVRAYAEDNKLHLAHWFTVDDLFFLKRGGRVNAATAVMGTMLSIKPVMHVDNKGKLINVSKARGRKAAIDEMLAHMKATVIEPQKQTCFICHGDCEEEANALAERLKTELGVPEVIVGFIGPVIGAHSGPGTLAVFYLGTER